MANNWAGFGKKKGPPRVKGAKRVEIDGIKFMSTSEGERYKTLKILAREGYIADLKLQVKYALEINGVHICNYIADFTYLENGKLVVEDLKGFVTEEFRMKFKLMQGCHGITIKLVDSTGKNRDVMKRPKAKKNPKPDGTVPAMRTNRITKQTAIKF